MLTQTQTALAIPYSLIIESQPFKTKFESAVSEAVDEAFTGFGDLKQTVYRVLEDVYGIKKEDIPNKIDAFTTAIEQSFGVAAKIIEIKIIKVLHTKVKDFQYIPRKEELAFVEFLSELKLFLNV